MTVVENKTQEQVFKLNQGNTLRLSYVTLEPRPSLPGPLPAPLGQLNRWLQNIGIILYKLKEDQ